jgi:transposase
MLPSLVVPAAHPIRRRRPAMLGPATCRDLDQPVVVSLDDLVPADHFYRHLNAQLDLSFVRDWARDASPGIGRPSIDPVVFCKLYLLMVLELWCSKASAPNANA